MADINILAIESSCDETAAAVVRNGREVLSNVIYSQIDLHTLYGGVVPEIASRKHIDKINQVVEKAIADSGMELKDMDAIRTRTRRTSFSGSVFCESTGIRCKSSYNRRASYRRTYLRQLYSKQRA